MWDISNVLEMDQMFFNAESFKQKLCGGSWVDSKATKKRLFDGSSGSISQEVCTSAPTASTTVAEGPYVSRRPITERELIARTPIATSASTPAMTSTIAKTTTCPKCGTFEKSGKKSCCAPGGAWFKNCGGTHNKNVDHKWFEGVAACTRKFKANDMLWIRSDSD